MRFLVIPCFNEEKRLLQNEVARCVAVLNCNVILVDDGSTDQTSELLTKLSLNFPQNIQVLTLATNVGKGEAVRAGFTYAFEQDATQVLFCDADFSVGANDLLRICNALEEYPECKAVLGSRMESVGSTIKRSAIKYFFGRAFAALVSLTLGHQIYDTQCGAKAFKVDDEVKRVFSQPFLSRWAFDVEIIGRLLRVHQPTDNQLLVRELPLQSWIEVSGSKLNLISRFRTVLELISIRSSLKDWS